MSADLVRILDGGTFVVSDSNGDIVASPTFPTGLFSFDTRFLSTWQLSVNGERLQALTVDDLEYYETRYFLVPVAPSPLIEPELSVIRQRSIIGSMHERLTVLNHEREPVHVCIRVDASSDFADLFEIKDVRQKKGSYYTRIENGCLRLGYQRGTFRRESVITSDPPAHVDERGLTFTVRLEPHSQWAAEIRVETVGPDGRDIRMALQGRPGRTRPQMRHDLEAWLRRAPRLECDNKSLATAYQRGLVDLAALRFMPLIAGGESVPAAGLPWFMSIFGRDSIFVSLQALPFVPGLAATTLQVLGALQGSRLDDFLEEEPGKILHEVRYGETVAFAEQPHSPYFGAADATPLFVVLLDEYERWTGDVALVRHLEPVARAALGWIDEYGDIMGNGYLWYQRRNKQTGLDNQCWKDSWDSISYHDGTLPGLPRATCELQGYAYDAKMRGARLAREFWNDPAYADALEAQAADLKRRFNHDYWVADREFYALALDTDGRTVDALSSNIGHLLWSGIVEESRAGAIAAHLAGPELFSGWGVRTLAKGEGRYNPVGYHVGTVWPFDNSIIAWGLRRYGFAEQAGRIAEAIIDAAQYFRGRLPEAFAGYERELTRYPVQYPTACSPQAWSTGTPMLLLRTMLGMEPHAGRLATDPVIPDRIGRITLCGVRGRWGRADVSAGGQPS
ncbi:glycogen debranching N-terminal domain-containing protein [Micromonospora sp. NPDC052213]|uniref:amylo-alpha-1,6-glucosidase n=1 Tax=Micromonospora sp. NPDC052213 TaxID=3155812 RepID=UPI00344197F5